MNPGRVNGDAFEHVCRHCREVGATGAADIDALFGWSKGRPQSWCKRCRSGRVSR